MAMTYFHFKAVAADGKVRTRHARRREREARRSRTAPPGPDAGLRGTPAQKPALEFKLPKLQLRHAPRRPVLHPGTLHAAERRRAAGSRPVHHQRTHRTRRVPHPRPRCPAHPQGRQVAGRLARHHIPTTSPTSTSTWCAPAKPPAPWRRSSSGSPNSRRRATNCAATSSVPWSTRLLLTLVGFGSIFVLLYFVVPRFASAFAASNMRVPAMTQALLDVSTLVRDLWPVVAARSVPRARRLPPLYPHPAAGALVGCLPPQAARSSATRSARPRPPSSPAPWARWSPTASRSSSPCTSPRAS